MKIELELPEHFIANLENRLCTKLSQVINERMSALERKSVKLMRDEAARMLRVTKPTLDKYIREGLLKAEKIGRRVLLDKVEIENFIRKSCL